MRTKICGRCKQEKPLTEFYKSKRDGYRSRCKPCCSLDVGEYYKRPEVKERHNAWARQYYKEYFDRPGARIRLKTYMREYMREYSKLPDVKLKIYARNYTNNLIVEGEIRREPCVMCANDRAEAHHLDYKRPWIIMWLCRDCHPKVHKLLEGK